MRRFIRLGIDFGEVTRALAAIKGVSEAFTNVAARVAGAKSFSDANIQDFYQHVDNRRRDVAHVYEYTNQFHVPSKTRLFSVVNTARKSSVMSNVVFRPSEKIMPVDPIILKTVARRSSRGYETTLSNPGTRISRHKFPDKAAILESKRSFNVRPGVFNMGIELVSRPSGKTPTHLIYVENGRFRRSTSRVWRNEFYGKFQKVFADYWGKRSAQKLAAHVERTSEQAVSRGVRMARQEVLAARARSIPRVSPNKAVNITDEGRPGIRYEKRAVTNRVRAETMKSFRRETYAGGRTAFRDLRTGRFISGRGL